MLRVWLPLTKDLRNQGLSNVTITNNGATYSSTGGKLGGCYTFDGNDYIHISMPSEMTTLKGTSVAAWVKSTSSTLALGGISNDVNYTVPMCTLYTSGWQFGNDAQNGYRYISGGTIANTNTWHHVCCTVSDTTITTYLDGVQVTSGAISGVTTFTSANFIEIGCDHPGGDEYLTGSVNDFRIYDHALSQMEVKELSKGLVLHYPLNRGGFGNENLLSRYVVPGQAGPTSTAAGGRTTWLGDYKITIPATENADTYFRLFMSEQLVSGQTYTISCQVDGLLSGSVYRFPMFAQSNTAMGVLNLDHNGLNSLTFTMNWTGTQTAATGANGETVYVNFLDDSARTIASGQGPITISNFKLEEGDKVTPWCPNILDSLYNAMGLNSLIEYDCSGFCNNSVYNSKPTVSSDTSKYNVSTYFGEYNTPKTDLIDNSLLPALTNCTITWWEKNDTTRTLLLTGQSTSHYIAASDNNTYYHGTVGGTKTLYRDGVAGTYKCEAGVWHHYALVGADISTWTALHLNSYGSYWYLKGLVSDFRIYATALSADDVKSLYQNSAYIDSSGNVYGAVHSEA